MIRKLLLLTLALFPTFAHAQTSHGRIVTDRVSNKQTISVTGATPDVSGGNVFKTNNGGPVTITNFLNGVDSQAITVTCGDTNTTFADNATIITASNLNIVCLSVGQAQQFVYDAASTSWRQQGAPNVSQIPNTVLASTSTPSVSGTYSASYSMTLTSNATLTITGTPSNGNLLSLSLTEDGTGGWTFTFPGNFVFAPSFTFSTAANAVNELTFKYDGTNWRLTSTGGSATGCSPGGATNSLQKNSGGACATTNETDDGSNFATTINARFKGPNPWVDITSFGARATPFNSMPTTTATTTASSTTVIVASGASFVNGDGIVIRGAGATTTIATPVAPTVVPSSAIGPTGTGQDAAAPAGAITNQYCVVAVDIGGGMSPCSPVTSVSTANTLGAQNVTVSSWTAGGFSSGSTVTVTTSAAHTMVAGTYIQIINDSSINGFWKVATVPDNTHFTFLTSNMVAFGFPTSGGAAATVYYWNSNHITWPEITNAVKYYVYGRTSGSMALIGVTTLQISTMCNSCISGSNPGPPALVANMFDDYGASMTQNISNNNVPDYVPVSPPVAAKNKDLVTTIVSGAGTTTLVVANAATNAVTSATMKIDNSININLAMNAASLNGSAAQGVVFIPATGHQGTQFETNSPLQMYSGSIGTISFIQAGQLNLGDMLWTQGGTSAFGTQVLWTGWPTNPNQGRGSFTRSSGPTITSSRATPMIYSGNKNWRWSNVVISNGQPNQGYTWISDDGGSIPGSTWDNVTISSSGANDTMIIGFLMRGDSNGGADFQFNHFSVTSGPGSQAPGVTTTPAFYGDGMPSPIVISDMFLSLRTMYFRMLPQGLQLTIEKIYDEGGIEPMVGAYNTGGSAGLNLEMRGVVADTMGAPMLSLFGTMSGNVKLQAWTAVGSGQPFTSMPNNSVSVVGAGPSFAYGTAATNPTVGTAQDGVMNGSMGPYAVTNQNSSFSVPNVMQHFVQGGLATPGCVISAGGTAPIQAWQFRIAPVFKNGNALAEGSYGPIAFCSTTSGQQTATVTWSPVPGAVGYDFAENSNVVNCTPNNQGGNQTTYVRNNTASTCGFAIGNIPGGGVTSLAGGGLSGTALRLNNNFTAAIVPAVATANRTATLPDATGTILLDSTVATAPALAPAPYDNFFRANGGLGSNWTSDFTGTGTVAISTNAVISGSATNAFTGSHWNATPFSNDQFAEATVATAPTGGRVGVAVRLNGGNNGYACEEAVGSIQINRILAGGAAFVTNAGHTQAVGDRLRIQIVGNALTCSVTTLAGALTTISGTVTDFATGTPGIVFFNGLSGSLTNFSAGNVPIGNTFAYTNNVYGDQVFFGDQQFKTGAVVVGVTPSSSTGNLTNGMIYTLAGLTDSSVAANASLVCTDANKKYTTSCSSSASLQWFDTTANGLGNYTNLSNSVVITSGQFAGNTAAAWNAASLTAALTFTADQYSAMTLSTITAGSSEVDECVRLQVGAFSGYCGGINTNTNTLFMKSVTAGATTTLASTAITAAVGDYTVISAVAGNITVLRYVNGVLTNTLGPIADATYATGVPGIAIFGNLSRGDNFEAGSIAALARPNYEQDWNQPQHFLSGITLGSTLSTPILTASGNSGRLAQSSGTLTSGNLASWDASGNAVDSTVATASLVTASSSNTLTNKTLDAEATGNAITIPFKPWFGAALCNNVTAGSSWNLPTASAPTPNCNTGTNVQEGTLDFADAQSAQYVYELPTDWTGTIDARLLFFDSSTSGTVIWNIATACTAVGGTVTDDTAFNTADAFATITLSTPANAQWVTTKTGLNTTGCSAGNTLQIKVSRATDTAANVARMKGLELTVRRTM